ncbi:hypothetical protein H7K28_12620 [Paenibacillus polymyxa]|jgi:hypothetical protein|uniref:hypothetical protein n=1 Tax=Paenibacillus TaxID=44249 RepID=UPI000D2F8BBA|nr:MULTISPECIES: hypothetical protein [Paenibacillus]KAF6616174.1 hypothetical protein HFE00_16760 [Paenibacillus sp. EKM101P]KAF6618008.1 hypothetical protein HFE03_23295 [Paenibacillus sp. EKM102P]KAF6626066.1 hypothetical protein HFE01_23145 [Paenibacillus sp. EKM10P]KAF6642581.1 hypothetical protein HFE02_23300 [Paenibacillus sp. EKM11P]MBY0020914.1 hypothetical protein [Paenibacillus polymyxa]
MDQLTKGTWVVNSNKHLMQIKANTSELSYFEATEQSGKAGTLLGRLIADKQEIIPFKTAKIFARQSGITPAETKVYLDYLKKEGKIDYNKDATNKIKELEIYCFSTVDALQTVANMYEKFDPSEFEQASLLGLQSTYELPRYHDEMANILTTNGISEEAAKTTIELQQVLGLVKTSGDPSEQILYNEYAFTGDPSKVVKALSSLDSNERDMVNEVQQLIIDSPGFHAEAIPQHISPKIISLMEGVGLLDGITVKSPFGEAVYYTTPQVKGQGVGNVFSISEDIFHKAKILLSCLRFGQTKSAYGRGRISTQDKMVNIVNKLCRKEWVGPCTAIGQDYQLLELDGVIETSPVGGNQYLMRLRQAEVGNMVKQLLTFKKLLPEDEVDVSDFLKTQPTGYLTPELRRKMIEATDTAPVADARARLLTSLRTGMN